MRPRSAVFAVCLTLVALPARAQVLVRSAELPAYAVFLSFGWDPTWTLGVGAVFGVDEAIAGHDLGLELELTAPLALLPSLSHWKLLGGAGLVVPLGADEGLGLGVDLETGLAVSDDAASRNVAWVLELTMAPGYYSRDGALALELGWRGALATYVTHHALVEDTFRDRGPEARAGDGPQDGWSPLAASRARVGLTGHVALSTGARVFGAVGFEFTSQAQGVVSSPPWLKPPFYGTLGVDASW